MTELKCIIKKDVREILRTGKIILFLALAFGIGMMVMLFTLIFSNIPDSLTSELPGIDIQSLERMMGTLYPKELKMNLGVFSYYIGFFYSLVTIIVAHSVLPRELTEGKWIIPLEKGYRVQDIIISKCLTYGTFAGTSVFLSYLVYYGIANTFMLHDMTFGNAFMCALIHGLNIFFILVYTLQLSVYFKAPIISAISMIGTVVFVPDLLNYFSFAKYLPTYSLNFVYESRDDYINAFFPILFNIFLIVVTYFLTIMKVEKRISCSASVIDKV